MDLDDKLTEALEEFGKLPHIQKLSDPKEARNRCGGASRELQSFLTERNLPATILCVQGLATPSNLPGVYPEDYDWRYFGHTVVVSDDVWIDFTARQISEDYGFPHIADGRTELRKWVRLDSVQESADTRLSFKPE